MQYHSEHYLYSPFYGAARPSCFPVQYFINATLQLRRGRPLNLGTNFHVTCDMSFLCFSLLPFPASILPATEGHSIRTRPCAICCSERSTLMELSIRSVIKTVTYYYHCFVLCSCLMTKGFLNNLVYEINLRFHSKN